MSIWALLLVMQNLEGSFLPFKASVATQQVAKSVSIEEVAKIFNGTLPESNSVPKFKIKIVENIYLIPKNERIATLKGLNYNFNNLSQKQIYIDLQKHHRAMRQDEFAQMMRASIFGRKPIFEKTTFQLDKFRKSQMQYISLQLAKDGIEAIINESNVELKLRAQNFLPKITQEHAKSFLVALYIESGIFVDIDKQNEEFIVLRFPEGVYTKDHIDYVLQSLKTIYIRRNEIQNFQYIANGMITSPYPQKEKIPISFKIAVYEPIAEINVAEREKRLEQARLNPFLLQSDDIFIDILTDSGTGAMSLEQWSNMLVGDESYAGSRSFVKLRNAISDITGFPYVLPTHQGRGAENVMDTALIKPGKYVIGNLFFDTTAAHILHNGGLLNEIPIEEVYDPTIQMQFKGNIDIVKLNEELSRKSDDVAYVLITVTNNTGGGLPVSMVNMKNAREVCKKHNAKLFMDGARFFENAKFIKEFEIGYSEIPIRDIVKEMCLQFDGMLMSSKKDAIVNIGGFIALNDKNLYSQLAPINVLIEGFPTYGGMSGHNMEALAQGLYEGSSEDYLEYRYKELSYLADKLLQLGIPTVVPFGGHSVFVDAGRFLPDIAKLEFPAQALVNELYLESGIRAVEIGTLLAGRDENGENRIAANEYLRLTIPRRVYTKEHLDYIAYSMWKVYQKKDCIRGLEFTYEPTELRHFQACFKWKNLAG